MSAEPSHPDAAFDAPPESIEIAVAAHLVIVAPHPDDEVISFGAALSEHVQRGGRVSVIAVTDGEACDDRADEARRARLVAERDAERRRALRVLGVPSPQVIRLAFPDGRVAGREADLVGCLSELLRATRRDALEAPVVVAPWRHDGHPDHEACARAALRGGAVLGVEVLEVPIWAWYSTHGAPSLMRRVVAVGAAARQAKRAAMECFTSQLDVLPSGRGPVLPADFLAMFDRDSEPVAT